MWTVSHDRCSVIVLDCDISSLSCRNPCQWTWIVFGSKFHNNAKWECETSLRGKKGNQRQLLVACLNYLSFTVIKTPWPRYRQKTLFGAHSFRGLLYDHDHHSGLHGNKQVAWLWNSSWELVSWSTSASQRELIGNGVGFETLKLIPSDKPTPTRPHFLILTKQFHNLGSQEFKYNESIEAILIETVKFYSLTLIGL